MKQPDSECTHARLRYHNWMVYAHNMDWSQLGCVCTRCDARCRMSAEDYIEIEKAAARNLSALGRRGRLP